MVAKQNPNLAMVQVAADKLKPLLDDIALIGGCATGLLLTDRAAAPARSTGETNRRADTMRHGAQIVPTAEPTQRVTHTCDL
jgi:hypothetical protein